MLKYNLKRLFEARGIGKPYSFLRKNGFSLNEATRIANEKVLALNPVQMEKLCIALYCSPNDLLEWIPSNQLYDTPSHPLYPLKNPVKIDLTNLHADIPLNKLEEFKHGLDELKEKLSSK